MKHKALKLFTVILMILSLFFPFGSAFSIKVNADFEGGDGSPGNPYQISTCDQFEQITEEPDASYVLNNDIDTIECSTPFVGISSFTGTFDGGNHVIIIRIIDGNTQGNSLFSSISDGAEVHNFGITGVIYADSSYTGSAVGYAQDSEIYNIASGVTINAYSGDYVGGVVGLARNTDVHDVYFVGSVKGDEFTGGIVGGIDGTHPYLVSSYSATTVKGNRGAGGAIGQSYMLGGTTTISNVFSDSTVTSANGFAGLVGNLPYGEDGGNEANYYNAYKTSETTCAETDSGPGFVTTTMSSCTPLDDGESTSDAFKGNGAEGVFDNWDTGTWTFTEGEYPTLTGITLPAFHGAYYIFTCDDLVDLGNNTDTNAVFKLANNIDTATCTDTFQPIPSFYAELDGNGHTITLNNVVVTDAPAGLFALGQGWVHNLALTGTLTANGTVAQVGSLVGSGYLLDIDQVSSEVTINAPDGLYIGGLAGAFTDGSITDSYFVGTVNGDTYLGGMIGWSSNIVEINRSYVAAHINGDTAAGGFVGIAMGTLTIADSFSESRLNAGYQNGGLIGRTLSATLQIDNSRFTGSLVPGTNVCYYTNSDSSSKNTSCNVVDGSNPNRFRGNSTEATIIGWNFIDIWTIEPGQYPVLIYTHNFFTDPIDQVDVEGNGSTGTPFEIANCDELQTIRNDFTANYILTSDISCSNLAPLAVSDEEFTGTLDGDEYTLTYTMSDISHSGLFEMIGEGSVIKNLDLNISITGNGGDVVGGLAGNADTATIQNITGIIDIDLGTAEVSNTVGGLVGDSNGNAYSNIDIETDITANVEGDWAYISDMGGITGESRNDTLTDINVTGAINAQSDGIEGSGVNYMGGVVGYLDSATVLDTVHSSVNMELTNLAIGGITNVGGLAGSICDDDGGCAVANSRWDGNMIITATQVEYVGGFAGESYFMGDFFTNSVENSESQGTITINSDDTVRHVGGLFGRIYYGRLLYDANKTSITVVSDDETVLVQNVGGIAGYMNNTIMMDTYSDAELTIPSYEGGDNNMTNIGGLVGEIYSGDIYRSYATNQISYGDDGATTLKQGGVGGLVGYISASSGTVHIVNSFSDVALDVQGNVQGIGELVGDASLEDNLVLTNNYIDLSATAEISCVGTDTTTGVQCYGVNSAHSNDSYFLGNQINDPLNTWDFDNVWLMQEEQYPELRDDAHTLTFAYEHGNGSEETPYQIDSCEELEAMGSDPTMHYELTDDVICTDFDFKPIGQTEATAFSGTLDGNNFHITGINIDQPNNDFIGLFSILDNATITNLNLEITVNADFGVGGLTGATVGYTSIQSVNVNADISCFEECGGVVGEVFSGDDDELAGLNMDAISAIVNITMRNEDGNDNYDIGGLIGSGFNLTMVNSYATGQINGGSDDYTEDVGGLVGFLYNDEISEDFTIQNSYSDIDMNIGSPELDTTYEDIGGLIGYSNNATVIDSYATGSMNFTGDVEMEFNNIGGLIGYTNWTNITTSYSSLVINVDGGYIYAVGGLVGVINNDGDITNSFGAVTFNFTDADGSDEEGGIVGGFIDEDSVFTNVYFDKDLVHGDECAGVDTWPGCNAVNLENSTPDYFKGNHISPPLNTWGFGTAWQVIPDDYPHLIYEDFTDTDHDGIADVIEVAGPNDGDANDDGQADLNQPNVTAFINPVTSHYVVLETTCTDTNSASVDETDDPDSGFEYPVGIMDFNITCPTPGQTATITQIFFDNYDASQIVPRKYNSVTHTYSTIPGATVQNVTIASQTALKITYNIIDGGSMDEDGTANGTIIDPSGPAVNGVGAPNTGLGGKFHSIIT